MTRRTPVLVVVLMAVGCSAEGERRLEPPPSVAARLGHADLVPNLPPESVMATMYFTCSTAASDRIAVLTIDPPDDRGNIRSLFLLCQTPVAYESRELGTMHEIGANYGSGDDPTTGAGYNLGAEVTEATDSQVTIAYDVTWTDGERQASAEGALTAPLVGVAEQEGKGGLVVRLAYHYGHERSNYCIQRTAGRLTEAISEAALAGRR